MKTCLVTISGDAKPFIKDLLYLNMESYNPYNPMLQALCLRDKLPLKVINDITKLEIGKINLFATSERFMSTENRNVVSVFIGDHEDDTCLMSMRPNSIYDIVSFINFIKPIKS